MFLFIKFFPIVNYHSVKVVSISIIIHWVFLLSKDDFCFSFVSFISATVITLEINRNFIITKLKLFINLKLHPHEDHIDYYFSRVSRKKVQIILKDKEKYIGKSSEIGINLNAWIVHGEKVVCLKIPSIIFSCCFLFVL